MLYSHDVNNNNNTSVLGDTRREKQIIEAYTNHSMLTPHTHTHTHTHTYAQCILWCLCWLRYKTDLISLDHKKPQPPASMVKLQFFVFFTILKFSGPSLPGMTSSTNSIHFNSPSSPISCLEVYYDRWWLSYAFCTGIRVHCLTMVPEVRDTE